MEEGDLRVRVRDGLVHLARYWPLDVWRANVGRFQSPVVVDVGLSYQRDDGDAIFLRTGPWWVKATEGVLLWADQTSGHLMCGAEWFRRVDQALDRQCRSERFSISRADARRYSAAMGWEYPEYRDEAGWA